jgi:hypothetical protein
MQPSVSMRPCYSPVNKSDLAEMLDVDYELESRRRWTARSAASRLDVTGSREGPAGRFASALSIGCQTGKARGGGRTHD